MCHGNLVTHFKGRTEIGGTRVQTEEENIWKERVYENRVRRIMFRSKGVFENTVVRKHLDLRGYMRTEC
jgi:hypothetical protein